MKGSLIGGGMKYSPAFLRLIDEARNCVRECDVHQVWQWLNTERKFYLIDVREESEWASGRIPCSICIGKGTIERDIEGIIPDTGATLLLYSRHGFRSVLAAENLVRMGYRDVVSMKGGWHEWLEAGYPMVDD